MKAVYQFYLGAYDGNPANLDPLPPQDSAKRYVELIGGADNAVAAAQTAFDKGDYRWTAELLNHVGVRQTAANKGAKELLARTYDQLGYVAEASTWRNSYLTAAAGTAQRPAEEGHRSLRLRRHADADAGRALPRGHGGGPGRPGRRGQGPEDQPGLQRHQGNPTCCGSRTPCCTIARPRRPPDANATLTLTKPIFVKMMAGTAGVEGHAAVRRADDRRQQDRPRALLSLIDKAPGTFQIVTR